MTTDEMRIRQDLIARAHVAAILTQAACTNDGMAPVHVKKIFDEMLRHVDKFVDGGE